MTDRGTDDGVRADEAGLLAERELDGFAHALGALARARVGAAETVVWVAGFDGRLARADVDGESFARDALGFDTLPAVGPPASAPGAWKDRFAFAALPLSAGDALLGVLVLAFPAAVPERDWDAPLRLAVAAAASWLDRRRLRAEITNAQSDGFVRAGAGLAHVLGNVLQAVQSAIDSARLAPTGDVRASLSEASGALGRASAVVRQLASLGGTRGDPQPTEMGALVAGLVAAIGSQMPEGITLHIERASRAELWCMVDAVAIEAALAGLLYRAREELGVAGRIALVLRLTTRGVQRLVEIEVRTTALRMPSSDRLSTPGLDARREVPGNDGGDTQGAVQLGLTMASAAVARYGGTIDERNGDMRVTLIRLPLIAPRGTASPSKGSLVAVRAEPARRLSVLIADDEPAVLRGVQRLLVLAGHEVRAAADGVEAVALARANPTLDVALLDLTMPKLGGPPLVAALRRVAPSCAVVVMTGYASTAMTEALRNEGVVAVLTKPVAGPALLAALEAAARRDPA